MDPNPPETTAVAKQRPRRIRKVILLLLVAVLSFVAGVFLFLRVGLDDDRLALVLVSQLERSTGRNVSLVSAHLSWLSPGTARLSLRGLEVLDRSGQALSLRVPRATLELNVARALSGTCYVSLLRLTEPVLGIPAEPVSRTEPLKKNRPHCAFPPWLPLVIKRLEIGGGRVILTSKPHRFQGNSILLQGVEAVVLDATPGAVGSFTVKGEARQGPVAGSFHVAGRLAVRLHDHHIWRGEISLQADRCPLLPLQALAANFNSTLPFSHGVVDLKCHLKGNSQDFHLSGEGGLSQVSVLPGRYFIKGATLDQAHISFSAARRSESLRIDVAELHLPGMTVSAEASFQDISSPAASVAITVRRADCDLVKFFPLVPLNLMSAEDRSRFGEAGLNGHVVITGGGWTGKVTDIMIDPWRRGSLALDAYLDKVSAFIPGAGLPIKNATGRVRLSADEVVFNGISFTLGTSPIVLNGGISDLRSTPKSDLFVSMTAQAQDLSPVLSNQAVARQLAPWVSWIEEPHGGVSVTLDVKGNVKRPSMKGRVVLENFQCRLPNFPLALKNINGSLRFRSSDVIFSGLKGVVGESPVDLSGKVSPDNLTITGEGKLSPSDLKKIDVLPSWCAVWGSIPATLSMKGRSPHTEFSARMELRGVGLRAGSVMRKEPGVPLALEASGSFGPDGVSVEDASAITPNGRVSAKGKVDGEGKAVIFVNLPPKGIPTNALIPLSDPGRDLQTGGRIEGDAVIKIDIAHPREVFVDANLQLSHVSLRLGFHKRVDGLTGTMRVRGKSISAAVERAKIGDSEFSGSVSITDVHRPKVDILVDFSFLDTTDFTAPPGHASPMTWGEWIRSNPAIRFLARSVGTGTLKANKGKTSSRAFADFRAHFEDQNGLIKARQWHISLADGIVRGDAQFDIRANTTMPFALDFQADHLRMERILLADPERVRLQGDVTAEGHLEWKTTSRRESHGIYKTGKIEVRVQDGVIHRFDALSKIFSFINLGSLIRGRFPDIVSEGLPFQRLSWTMDVFDDKWKFQDVKLLSDAARVDASGMYFSNQDRIDFKVEVSPLVGLDAIVSGLLGNLVTKDGKTLSTTFSVRGLPATPDVRLEPFANFRPERN